jgi:hypothetical protein
MAEHELHSIIVPLLKEEYRDVSISTGMTLENFIQLRFTEIVANELRFPGSTEFYLKKIKRMKRFGLFGKIIGIALIIKKCVTRGLGA